jgi:hypothetical protein
VKFNPEEVDAADLGLALSQLPHDHQLVVAARLALEVRADRMLSGDDYPGGRYHRLHDLPERTAVEQARYGPTGDRDLWVRFGPAGPPAIPAQRDEPAAWVSAPDEDAGAARVRGG